MSTTYAGPRIPVKGELALPSDAPILHRILTIVPNGPEPIRFKMAKPQRDPAPGEHIQDYALKISETPSVPMLEAAETPFDINPTERCHIILELDASFNWEFTPGGLGVTPKVAGFEREDYGLTYAVRGQLTEAAETAVVPAACRVLYWGILWRTEYVARDFDFHVDFYQNERGRTLRMPTIFDPGVPNSGGPGIP